MRWKGVNRAEGRKQVRWGWRGGDCLPSDFGLDTTSGMINVCVYACLHFVHMCRRWERAGWGYCYFSEDMMSHCTSHTHTRARIQSGQHTRRVSLRITVAFCGRHVQTMTGKQEPQHNEREQGPSLIHTHTSTCTHTCGGQSASLRPLASQLPSRLLVPLCSTTANYPGPCLT